MTTTLLHAYTSNQWATVVTSECIATVCYPGPSTLIFLKIFLVALVLTCHPPWFCSSTKIDYDGSMISQALMSSQRWLNLRIHRVMIPSLFMDIYELINTIVVLFHSVIAFSQTKWPLGSNQVGLISYLLLTKNLVKPQCKPSFANFCHKSIYRRIRNVCENLILANISWILLPHEFKVLTYIENT